MLNAIQNKLLILVDSFEAVLYEEDTIFLENMKSNTIPGEGKKIAKVDYWIYDREEPTKIVEEMFGDYLLTQ